MAEMLTANPDGTYVMPEVVWIPLGNLEPGPSYRTQFRGMAELESSIRQFGVLNPLWVQPDPDVNNRFLIFAGRRRYDAAKKIARERCDPALDTSISIQVGRYLVPCRVFRDLAKIHQGLLGLTENVTRHDPSAIDTARELRRLKGLLESDTGRPVSVDEILAMLFGRSGDRKRLGKRQIYRLLRIAELNSEVAAAAKEGRLALYFLDQVSRLPSKEEQLELIRLIADLNLARNEVREIVNTRLSGKDMQLSTIGAKIAEPRVACSIGTLPVRVPSSSDRLQLNEDDFAIKINNELSDPRLDLADTEASDRCRLEMLPVQRERSDGMIGLSHLIDYLRRQTDIELLRAGDVLEAWSMSMDHQASSGRMELEQWLESLTSAGHDFGEMERLNGVLAGEELSRLEVEIVKLVFMCQGVLPEHLAGYVRQIKEAMSLSSWYQDVVRCSLELAALLHTPEDSKSLNATAKRFLDAVFHEFFWLSTAYDPKLQYGVERLPTVRKKEFCAYS